MSDLCRCRSGPSCFGHPVGHAIYRRCPVAARPGSIDGLKRLAGGTCPQYRASGFGRLHDLGVRHRAASRSSHQGRRFSPSTTTKHKRPHNPLAAYRKHQPSCYASMVRAADPLNRPDASNCRTADYTPVELQAFGPGSIVASAVVSGTTGVCNEHLGAGSVNPFAVTKETRVNLRFRECNGVRRNSMFGKRSRSGSWPGSPKSWDTSLAPRDGCGGTVSRTASPSTMPNGMSRRWRESVS